MVKVRSDGRRALFGRVLVLAGRAGWPLALGAILGFWASDRGLSFVPDLVELVAVTCGVSLVAIVVGHWLEGSAVVETERGMRLRKRVLFALGFGFVAALARLTVFWIAQPSALTSLRPAELRLAQGMDEQRYRELSDGLARLVRRVEDSRILTGVSGDVLSPEEERLLLSVWVAFSSQALELEQMRRLHEDWYRFDISRRERARHVRSFLLMAATELALQEQGTRLGDLLARNDNARKFLDNPHPAEGLTEHSFSRFRQEVLGSRDQARAKSIAAYLAWLERGLEADDALADATWLHERVKAHIAGTRSLDRVRRAELGLRAELQPLRRAVRRAWLPAQEGVARWMGDVKLRRAGWYLINTEQQAALDQQLEPGDILLSRKNWHLSNVGLPGFWPHGILYLGDPQKLQAHFDTSEVRSWIHETTGEPIGLGDVLARRWPARWREFLDGAPDGPHRVMEGVAPGVVLHTLEKASGDYMVALRPNLPRVAKAQAILEAFDHLGKPYDYDFDFATDHALVCTELIYRAYRPATGKLGLQLPLIDVAGRRAMPANELAKLFAREYGSANAQLSFVAFLDAHEENQRAFPSTVESFLTTPNRSKWDLALE